MSHSRLAPSSAKQWMTCTASIKFIDELKAQGKIPEETSSIYADEGTTAHECASNILEGKMTLDDIEMHSDVLEHDYDVNEMVQCVGEFVSLAGKITEQDDRVFIEERVPLFYKPEDAGTVDYGLMNSKRVYVLDLKYGRGVNVEAKDNPQLAIYALSMVAEYGEEIGVDDDTLIVMAIYQPRCHECIENPLKLWAVELGDLKTWARPILEAVGDIVSDNDDVLKFDPGHDQCQFCDAKGLCAARQEWSGKNFSKEGIKALDELTVMDSVENPVPIKEAYPFDSLTDSQIAAVVKYGGDVIKWINSIQADAKKRIESGAQIEGLKIVQGNQGKRSWTDEEEADKLLSGKLKADERYTKKLVTLPQAEKLLKGKKLSTRFKNRLDQLTERKPGTPVLVPADDPRKDLSLDVEDAFSEVDEDLMLG